MSKSHREQGLDYNEGVELSWCPSWSNTLWQGWNCGLVYCPGGNATDPIWRVLASSQGISCWTPLKPQHSNPNPNPLANQIWWVDFLTTPIPLIIPYRFPATQKLMLDSCKMVEQQSEEYHTFLWYFCPSLKQNCIAYCSSKVSSHPDSIFEIHQLWQSGFSRVYSNCCCGCSF